MKRLIILTMVIVSGTCLSFNVNAFHWRDLWSTPDEQAQILLQQGQANKAKDLFKNKDWAGVANYRAGDYKKAAALFKDNKTETGFYNLGNSLAQLHQFEQAIKAYDKAIALNPDNKEAIYNRKLLNDLLKKSHKKRNQNKDSQTRDNQDKDEQNKDGQARDNQDKGEQNKDGRPRDNQDKGEQNKDGQPRDNQDKDEQNKDGQPRDNQDKDEQNKDGQGEDSKAKAKQDKNKAKQTKDNENRKKSNQDEQKSQQSKNNHSAAAREKKMANQLWLKMIPDDDPGGLMREKFLRDHLKRKDRWYQ